MILRLRLAVAASLVTAAAGAMMATAVAAGPTAAHTHTGAFQPSCDDGQVMYSDDGSHTWVCIDGGWMLVH